MIGFIGSVFSPWYRWSGRRNPDNHCCLNVVTYGPGGRWTMTDRGAEALRATQDRLQIGPSAMVWDEKHGRLIVEIDERTTPHLGRLQGEVRLTPTALTGADVALHPTGRHVWRPFAPIARIEVDLDRPGWRWSGHGYFDANFGTASLEEDFRYWSWARLPTKDGAVAFYDALRRDGTRLEMGLRFGRDGAVERIEPPAKSLMSRSWWAIKRETRADPGYRPHVAMTMLEAPFYNRAAIRTKVRGEEVVGVYEALDLDRFASPLLKPMLAVRVPRRRRWRAA